MKWYGLPNHFINTIKSLSKDYLCISDIVAKSFCEKNKADVKYYERKTKDGILRKNMTIPKKLCRFNGWDFLKMVLLARSYLQSRMM